MTARPVKWAILGAPSEQQSGTSSGTLDHQQQGWATGGCAVHICNQMTNAWVAHYGSNTGQALNNVTTAEVQEIDASQTSGSGGIAIGFMHRLGDYLMGAGSSMNPLCMKPFYRHGPVYVGHGQASDQAALASDWQQAASDFNVVSQTNNFIRDWVRLKHEQSARWNEPKSERVISGSEGT